MAVCDEVLDKRTSKRIHTSEVLNMIGTVLGNNCFTLNVKSYIQKEGVTICYKRFIDDDFGIWIGSPESLQ